MCIASQNLRWSSTPALILVNLSAALASLLLAGLVLLLTAGPAMAHTELKTSDPKEGASLSTVPQKVTLTFEEAVTLPNNPIRITGPDGSAWDVGTPTISGASVTAPVTPSGPAGAYTLAYTVTADDGDAVSGKVHFDLTVPASTPSAAPAEAPAPTAAASEPAAPPAAPAPASNGFPAWGWAIVVVVVLAAVAGLLVSRSRRARDTTGTHSR